MGKVLKAWEEKSIYDSKFINGLQSAFTRLLEFNTSYIRDEAEKLKSIEKSKIDPEKEYIFPKLIDVEEYLREEYKENSENLEKKCKQNGIFYKGSFEQIIERMLNLEYFVLKREYLEMRSQASYASGRSAEDLANLSGQLELQLIVLRNRIVDLQKLNLNLDSEALDGAPITVEDIELLDLPKDILIVKVQNQCDEGIDGQELLPEEMKFLEGHEMEESITIELQD